MGAPVVSRALKTTGSFPHTLQEAADEGQLRNDDCPKCADRGTRGSPVLVQVSAQAKAFQLTPLGELIAGIRLTAVLCDLEPGQAPVCHSFGSPYAPYSH